MPGIEDLLGSALGGNALGAIASQLGTSPENAHSAIGAALPALLGQLKANADDPEKGPLLDAALTNDHDGAVLDDVQGFLGGPVSQAVGGKILGHVFGSSKDQAAASVAKAGGIDTAQALKLLAMLAPIVLGALGKSRKQQGSAAGSSAGGGLGDLSGMLGGLLGGAGGAGALGSILGGLMGGGAGGGGDLGSVIGSVLGGGGPAASSTPAAPNTPSAPAPTPAKGGLLGKILGSLAKKR